MTVGEQLQKKITDLRLAQVRDDNRRVEKVCAQVRSPNGGCVSPSRLLPGGLSSVGSRDRERCLVLRARSSRARCDPVSRAQPLRENDSGRARPPTGRLLRPAPLRSPHAYVPSRASARPTHRPTATIGVSWRQSKHQTWTSAFSHSEVESMWGARTRWRRMILGPAARRRPRTQRGRDAVRLSGSDRGAWRTSA